MAVILVDLDEVLFPFAYAYRDFRARRGLPGIPADAWDCYEIGATRLPGHQELMAEFFHDPAVIATAPLAERAEDLRDLARRHAVVACTGRYAGTEGPGTLAWADRWAPWLTGVEFVGWHPESGLPSGKPAVACRLGAIALVDDTPVHLEGLPVHAEGLLVTRPPGVPSAPGALHWPQAAARLRRLAGRHQAG